MKKIRQLLFYSLPTTWLYGVSTMLYGLLAMLGLVPFWNLPLWLVFPAVLMLLVFTTVVCSQFKARTHHRWIIESGSSRGFRIYNVPILDIFLVLAIILFGSFLYQNEPMLLLTASYILLPFGLALLGALISGMPDPLVDVSTKRQTLRDYAEGYAQMVHMQPEELIKKLCEENGWQSADQQLEYAQVILLPQDLAGKPFPPKPRPCPR